MTGPRGWLWRWGGREVRREEVHSPTFCICCEGRANRAHCWTTCDKNQEIMDDSGFQAEPLEGGRFHLSEMPKHCAGSHGRMDVEQML